MSWADYVADRSARRWLSGIAGQLEPGWAALARDPALWSAYEQHVASVAEAARIENEFVPRTEPVTTLVLLAGHAHDVWTEASAKGWRPPADIAGWTTGEWTGLRMLACYRLAAGEPHGPALSPAAAAARARTAPPPRKRVR